MEPDTPNFDSVARAYRWMEYFTFGRMLERCRFHFLTRCSHARRALVLGDGDGRFTARLLIENPIVQVDAVDASAAMLAVLRERACDSGGDASTRLNTLHADIRRFTPVGRRYDLVVSHFFLDCLSECEVAATIARLCPHMTEDAIWLISEFAVPETGWRHLAARIMIRGLYYAFYVLTGLRVRDIPDYTMVFKDHGFRPAQKAVYLGGILTAEVWERRTT